MDMYINVVVALVVVPRNGIHFIEKFILPRHLRGWKRLIDNDIMVRLKERMLDKERERVMVLSWFADCSHLPFVYFTLSSLSSSLINNQICIMEMEWWKKKLNVPWNVPRQHLLVDHLTKINQQLADLASWSMNEVDLMPDDDWIQSHLRGEG